ncbi:MAG: mandelate racemase/muconate lactonizing enzyme family protein [Pseudomonadota bacterium]
MQITRADAIRLKIPFTDPGAGTGLFQGTWTAHDFVLLRLETDTGLTAWGEAFSYFCAGAVHAMVADAVCPLLIGRDGTDMDRILAEMRHKLHLVGRYGITMFAISAADIALHDLAAKAAGVSLAEHLGGRRHAALPAYASLIRYGDPDLVRRMAAQAAGEGYPMIKLHEIELSAIRAGREGAGDRALTNDVNCNWSADQTRAMAPALQDLDLMWLEEPIFPPEDFETLAQVRNDTGLAIASGENLCTAHQFAQMTAMGGADYVQPSVTKIGGIAETLATRKDAAAKRLRVAHHAPYFGPGLLATLQILAAAEAEEYVEWLYVEREADLFPAMPKPQGGRIAVPDGPGLGLDPDPDVLLRYAV